MLMKFHSRPSTAGAVLIAAILAVSVLAAISAVTLQRVTAKHQNSYQASAWREALPAAEAGVERAKAELRVTIDDPAQAWTGWVVTDAAGNPAAVQTINRSGKWPPGYSLRMTDTLPPQSAGMKELRYSVTIDVPASLAATTKTRNQSYRIRSTGISTLPGTARAPSDSRDASLRRLSLVRDRTLGFPTSGGRLSVPQATRTIEVVAKPESVFKYGLIAAINFSLNKKTYIDGFNSNYAETSTGGKYDPAKRTPRGGTVVANRWKKKPKPGNAEEKFDVGRATIYGDLLIKGSLKNVKNYENVKGDKVTNTSMELSTNHAPQWTTVTENIKTLDGKLQPDTAATYKIAEKQAKAGGPAAQFEAKSATTAAVLAAKGMELPGGSTPDSPTRYKVEKIGVDKKDESLILSNPPGVTESWIEVWVTNEMTISKGGTVFVSKGVHATFYLEGKAEIKETKNDRGGFILESGFAGDLKLIGIEKPDSKKETDDEFSPKKRSGKISITDADFTGVINAPDWDVDFKPKDWDKEDTIYGGQLFGSVLGRKVKIGNGADYHYDEAVAEVGSVQAYNVASWVELAR